MPRFLISFLLLLMATLGASPANAEVLATFYSHDFGDHFPHAFIFA